MNKDDVSVKSQPVKKFKGDLSKSAKSGNSGSFTPHKIEEEKTTIGATLDDQESPRKKSVITKK